jgi:hypothetical protein
MKIGKIIFGFFLNNNYIYVTETTISEERSKTIDCLNVSFYNNRYDLLLYFFACNPNNHPSTVLHLIQMYCISQYVSPYRIL